MRAKLRQRSVLTLRKLASAFAPDRADFWQKRIQANAAQAFLDAALALQREERHAEAGDVLARAAGAFPENRDILIEAALFAHHAPGRHGEAILRWDAALAVAADHSMCHAGLSAKLRDAGQLDRALSVISAALDRFPGDLLIVTEAARIATARQAETDALSFWAIAIGTAEPHPEWLHAHAATLWRLGRRDEAQAAVEQARAQHPNDPALRHLEAELNSVGASAG